jgi:hypothetical protein
MVGQGRPSTSLLCGGCEDVDGRPSPTMTIQTQPLRHLEHLFAGSSLLQQAVYTGLDGAHRSDDRRGGFYKVPYPHHVCLGF